MSEPAVPPAAAVLHDLRGLRSAPPLTAAQRQELCAALTAALAGCEWFTLGVMATSAGAALAALRSCECALGWPALQPQAPADPQGPVFLKGNQRTGSYLLRSESGLGEGILITGHNPADPSRQDTWGPLPLDLFDAAGTVGS
jgi:hypothetical protein